jgi:drug/metabolite transporter (DMT)-like permease
VFYGFGIKGGQLSVLYPMVSLGSVWTLIWSRIFFQEAITREKLFGLALILVGVTLVGMGSG